MEVTFDSLPQAVTSLRSEIRELKELLLQSNTQADPQTQGEAFLTIDQASQLLHLSKATLYSKCSRNEISYFKRGKRLYFSKEKLVQFIVDGNRKTIDEIKNESASYLKKKGGDNE